MAKEIAKCNLCPLTFAHSCGGTVIGLRLGATANERDPTMRTQTRSSGLIFCLASLALAASGLRGQTLAGQPAPVTRLAAAIIPFTEAAVERADDGRLIVRWTAPATAGEVRVLARSTPDGAGPGRLVGQSGPTGSVAAADLPPAPRWWFELRPRRGAALIIAERSLHLASAPNFRDVGGYRTADGRWVRMGLAYRSDQLDRLTDADLAVIAKLAPTMVVDLRTDRERRQGADRLPPGAQPLVEDVLADAPPGGPSLTAIDSPDAAAQFLVAANRQFVDLASARKAYTALFDQLEDPGGEVVYHCTAGKDRTGWATAVLLTLLGVPRETVMTDYLASNGYLTDKNAALFKTLPPQTAARLEPLMTVRRAYLDSAFAEVDHNYGSFDRYLKDALGLDAAAVARLKDRFLEGAPAR
jgi:protein-tyrosine phosphatase